MNCVASRSSGGADAGGGGAGFAAGGGAGTLGADADGGETLGDALGIEERGFAAAEDRATIAGLMRGVTPRERQVLWLRFACDLTQAEIGEQVGVSQMQVSRIIRQGIARLRAYASVHDDESIAA